MGAKNQHSRLVHKRGGIAIKRGGTAIKKGDTQSGFLNKGNIITYKNSTNNSDSNRDSGGDSGVDNYGINENYGVKMTHTQDESNISKSRDHTTIYFTWPKDG